MSDNTTGTELAGALDAAFAAYQRHYGRFRAADRLRLMLARSYEAQRLLDEANAAVGEPVRKAAE
jgi:hypothetical protein